MITIGRTNVAGELIASGRSESPVTMIRRRVVALRLWWLDHCTREGLRCADERILYDAGCRRTETGRIVPLNLR